ncbi:unnamed protein product [Moneuplotes crassus]|uniref:Uncharacterized protein n=1 Tax=Euplotes crassus TaxID=5936 RepID=A0AAD1UMY1_EUPCR|nr:unnamed protein product [Moneuplotes crassus]
MEKPSTEQPFSIDLLGYSKAGKIVIQKRKLLLKNYRNNQIQKGEWSNPQRGIRTKSSYLLKFIDKKLKDLHTDGISSELEVDSKPIEEEISLCCSFCEKTELKIILSQKLYQKSEVLKMNHTKTPKLQKSLQLLTKNRSIHTKFTYHNPKITITNKSPQNPTHTTKIPLQKSKIHLPKSTKILSIFDSVLNCTPSFTSLASRLQNYYRNTTNHPKIPFPTKTGAITTHSISIHKRKCGEHGTRNKRILNRTIHPRQRNEKRHQSMLKLNITTSPNSRSSISPCAAQITKLPYNSSIRRLRTPKKIIISNSVNGPSNKHGLSRQLPIRLNDRAKIPIFTNFNFFKQRS